MRRFFATLCLVCGLPSLAGAATYYVAEDCRDEGSPCTTNLQTALDSTAYDTVEIVANATLTGDFLIDRALTLQGAAGAALVRESGGTYVLRIEDVVGVVVKDLDVTGRIGISGSRDVLLDTLVVDGGSLAIQLDDAEDVLLDSLTVTATERAVDAVDTLDLTLSGGSYDSDDYALVASSSTVTTTSVTLDGTDNAVVLQDGNAATTPSLAATSTIFVVPVHIDHVWMWDDATTSYTSCTPSSPSEDQETSGDLVSLIGYQPFPNP